MLHYVDKSTILLLDLIEEYLKKARKAKNHKEYKVYQDVIIDLKILIEKSKRG